MDLKDIVSVTGVPGLHRIKSTNPRGVFVESLEDNAVRFISGSNSRVMAVENITVYGKEKDIEIKDVFLRMLKSEAVPEGNGDEAGMRKYFASLFPEYDADRVYAGDIKKIIRWWHTLRRLNLIKEEEQPSSGPEGTEVAAAAGQEEKAAQEAAVQP